MSNEATKIYKSACPYDCFDCCSFDVHVANGTVEKIKANGSADLTAGFLCKKGIGHRDRMYHPDRLMYPMRRTAEGFQRIDWSEAYDLISQKISEARAEFGPTSVASYFGGGAAGKLKEVHEVFFSHLGGYTDFTGSICWGAGIEATRLDFGAVRGHHPDDLKNSQSIILWGRNPVETNVHLVPYIKKAKERGCKVYLVDPIESKSIVLADEHILLKPDSDWAFAAACIAVCLKQGLAQKHFINNHVNDDTHVLRYLEALDEKQLAQLIKAAGVSMELVEKFTQLLIKGGPATCFIGYGPQRYLDGGFNIRAIDLLFAVTGNIGIPGGGVNFANQTNKGMFSLDFALPERKPEIREIRQGEFGEALLAAEPPVKVLFIGAANPVCQMTDSNQVVKALQNIPFKVCLEHFLTDTAALCELVLPVTYFTETEDIIFSGMWNSSIKHVAKCVEPPTECKSEFEIFQTLAQKLGLDGYPTEEASVWLQKGLEKWKSYGIGLDRLREIGVLESPLQKQVQWEDHAFLTEDRRFHAFDKDCLLRRMQQEKEKAHDGKINLITVHHSDQINSQLSVPLKPQTRPVLQVHPLTAKHFDLTDGDCALAVSEHGALSVDIAVTEKASPYAAFMKQGAWLESGGPVNLLTASGVTEIGNQAIQNDVRISLKKQV